MSATIGAPAGVVFAILSEVAGWPSWQPSVSPIELNDKVSLRSTLRSKTGDSRIVS